MKKYLKPDLLPLLVLAAGVVGMLLQLWQYVGGTDEKGLILRGHISAILLVILTVFVLALILLGTWGLREGNQYRFNFPASLPGCVGAGLAAIMIFVTAVGDLIARQDFLVLATGLAGLVAGASMVAMSIGRLRGRQVCCLFPLAVCLFLMMHLICQYRVWSGEPQIQTYAFPLLGFVFLMLSVYHNAMFDYNCGSRRGHSLTHLMAIFLCCIAFVGSDHPWMYLCYIFWMLMDLCDLTPMPSSRKKGA
jgi:hypothetical protein